MNKIGNSVPEVYLPIMGGLGNQLFQVHAAASMAERVEIRLDEELFGEVTSDSNLEYEIKYRIQNTITGCGNLPYRWITRRLSGLIMRINPLMENWKLARIAGRILRALATRAFSARYKTTIKLIAPNSVGFEPLDPIGLTPVVMLGYFQSYRYINENKISREIKSTVSSELGYRKGDLDSSNGSERPLIVHVRLGDYLKNPKIGFLDSSYYTENLSRVYAESNCSKLWLFSNDIPSALEFIPHELMDKLIVKEQPYLSDSHILDLMAQGHAYFIANSTFSWWAATLSSAPSSNIYAPNPWFSGLVAPIELLPPNWNSLPSKFKLKNS